MASTRSRETSSAAPVEPLKDARAVTPLIAILRERVRYLEEDAVPALAEIGDGRAVEPLIAELESCDLKSAARRAAARALVNMYQTGQLTAAQRKLILTKRGAITAPHSDKVWTCVGSASVHDDRSVAGIPFPL